MKKNITILGHPNPDVDSIISGSLLSEYLRFKGYNANYVIPDSSIDEESRQIVKLFGIESDKYKGSVEDDSYLILVDHHETEFKGNVVAVIDHHPTIKKFDYPVYINKKASATSKLVYDIIKNDSPEFLNSIYIERILVAMLVDTCSFKSSKTNTVDIPWAKEICEELSLDFDKLKKIGYCLTNLDNLEKASINGFKQFTYGDKIVKTSYIQCDSFKEHSVYQILNILSARVKSEDIFMWMFLVTDIESEKSWEYQISSSNISLTNYDYIASRGSVIMPKIEKMIKNI